MVVFDTNILLPMLWPNVPVPEDPKTGEPITDFRKRIGFLIESLEKSRTRIIIPTPVISEAFVRAGEAGPEILDELNRSSVFRIEPFDLRAAIEVAEMTRVAIANGDIKDGGDGPRSKIKYDRQIIAIAKVAGATVIYSDDRNLSKFGRKQRLSVIGLSDLPLPPVDPQKSLDLDDAPSDNKQGAGTKRDDKSEGTPPPDSAGT